MSSNLAGGISFHQVFPGSAVSHQAGAVEVAKSVHHSGWTSCARKQICPLPHLLLKIFVHIQSGHFHILVTGHVRNLFCGKTLVMQQRRNRMSIHMESLNMGEFPFSHHPPRQFPKAVRFACRPLLAELTIVVMVVVVARYTPPSFRGFRTTTTVGYKNVNLFHATKVYRLIFP